MGKAIKSKMRTIICCLLMSMLVFTVVGCSADSTGNTNTNNQSQKPAQQTNSQNQTQPATENVTVYFYDENATQLYPEKHEITKQNDLQSRAAAAIEELIKGPLPDSSLKATIPKGTKLLSLKITGDTAYVDFSRELISYGGGSTYELGIYNSVLSTLGQFSEISKVQFLLDGKIEPYLPEGTEINKPVPVIRAAK